jgi:hypothetical protein
MGRRQALESAVKRAEQVISNDETRFRLERELYSETIGNLDKQILEYDKLLAEARQEQSRLSQPRTGRVTRSTQREQKQLSDLASTASVVGGGRFALKAQVVSMMEAPKDFTDQLKAASLNMLQKQSSEDVEKADLVALTRDFARRARTIPDKFQRGNAFTVIARELEGTGKLSREQAEGVVAQFMDDETRAARSVEARTERMGELYSQGGGKQFDKFLEEIYPQAAQRGAYFGGSVSSVTQDEVLPGEQARLNLIRSKGFQQTADALRDDGMISDSERKALSEAGVRPEDFLDIDLMQAIRRTGRLEAERGSLADRRAASQEKLSSMVRPDASMQRQRELTSMFFGPATVSPGQAFFQPKKVQEGITKQAKEMNAKQALIKGFVRASKGDMPELNEEDNAYASQLTEAISAGNAEAVKQSFQLMNDAGVDQERLVSAFGVASRRARELDARRKAQAAQADAE